MNPHLETLVQAYPDSICAQLHQWAQQYAESTALVTDTHRWSYRELDQVVLQTAAGFSDLGLRAGERVLVQLPNCAAFVVTVFALMRLGCLPILAMPTQRRHDVAAFIDLAQPTAYVIPEADSTSELYQVAQALREMPETSLRHLLVAQSTASLTTSCVDLSQWMTPNTDADLSSLTCPYPASDDIAILLLSGGTTGTPKLIPRTHADYSYNFTESAAVCQLSHTSVSLAVLPAAHNFTFGCPGILGTLSQGGKVVLSETASCDEAMPLMAREGVTHLALVPALARLWLEAREWEDSDLSSLQVLQVGGAKLDATTAKALQQTFPGQLQQVFGMAEGLLCYTRLTDDEVQVQLTQGAPLSPLDEIKIVDDAGHPVAQGEVGQLLTRGPYTITGYYRAEAHNAVSFDAEGFYITGDRVRQDARGYLTVEGRVKEQINRAGEKIAAAEVEDALNKLPDVAASAVVGVPDLLLGERICAFLIMAPDANTEPDLHHIRQQLQQRGFTDYKCPDQVESMVCWPLTAVGKIDKKQLVERAKQTECHTNATPMSHS